MDKDVQRARAVFDKLVDISISNEVAQTTTPLMFPALAQPKQAMQIEDAFILKTDGSL